MTSIIPVKPAIEQHSSIQSASVQNNLAGVILTEIFTARKKTYKLCLSADKLVWERHKKENGNIELIGNQ